MDEPSLLFRPITTTAIAIIAAGLLLLSTWRKTADLWLPHLDDRSRAVWRTAALVSGVLVAALYIQYDHCSDWPMLLSLSLISLALCLLALLGHIVMARDRKHADRQAQSSITGIVVLYLAWNVCGTCALTGAAKAVLFKREAQGMHQEIGLTAYDSRSDKFLPVTPETPLKTKARLKVYLHESIHECEGAEVEWQLIPEHGAGTVDGGGTYTPPDNIGDQPLRVKVRVISVVHRKRNENATIDIFVQPDIPDVDRKTKKVEKDGSEAIFDVMVITSEHAWACESETTLTSARGGEEVVRSLANKGAFNGYQDVMALGTASHEGERGKEDGRADNRAGNLGQWIKAALSPGELSRTGVNRVNLGQYRRPQNGAPPRPCSVDTANERPLVIIGVVRKDSKIELGKGLEQVFSQNRGDPLFSRIFEGYPPPWTVKRLE